MNLNYESDKPIFAQIAVGIEEAIISGAFAEEQQIPSVSDFSVTYKINPATALKGISTLVDDGIIYKKRGIGMFVKEGARDILTDKRRSEFIEKQVTGFVEEARRLGITLGDLISMLERSYQHE